VLQISDTKKQKILQKSRATLFDPFQEQNNNMASPSPSTNNMSEDESNHPSTNVDFLFLAKTDNACVLSNILNTLSIGKKSEVL
jgi:hypothetical protein